ncbi:methyltransferase domain-containing protein [Aquincola tertiaricarbonis]|uniref:methyltransferase domain-containing protein n=1 Tax=Aquincola tertiaricarbonis TaxID=391953 RepID=UPI000614D4C3|nr:methyltransferase domain-containing protein [Aquincola tertiaricarbonis]
MPVSFLSRFVDYNNPASFGSRLRTKRSGPILHLIDASFALRGSCGILDVGGTSSFWNIVPRQMLRDRNVRITLLNIEKSNVEAGATDVFDSVAGDACDLSQYESGSFDLVLSNSVIEHVGMWRSMVAMATEIRRVGKAYYVQTPNFWFPVEPHYIFPLLHWLPMPWRIRIAMSMPLGSWPQAGTVHTAAIAQQAAMLLDCKMLGELFPDAELFRERFFGLSKSLIAVRREPLPSHQAHR